MALKPIISENQPVTMQVPELPTSSVEQFPDDEKMKFYQDLLARSQANSPVSPDSSSPVVASLPELAPVASNEPKSILQQYQDLIAEQKAEASKEEDELSRRENIKIIGELLGKGVDAYSKYMTAKAGGGLTVLKPEPINVDLSGLTSGYKDYMGRQKARRQEMREGALKDISIPSQLQKLQEQQPGGILAKTYAEKIKSSMPKEDLSKVSPESLREILEVQNKAKETSPTALLNLQIQQKRLELQEAAESRRREALKSTQKQQEELSSKDTEKLTGFQNTLDRLKEVRDLKKSVNTGPFAAPAQQSQKYIPFTDMPENFAKLQQISGMSLFDYIKNTSGVQFSDQERKAMEQNMPNVNDDDRTFNAKLGVIENIVEKKFKNETEALALSKSDATKFYNEAKKKEQLNPELKENEVARKDPKTGQIHIFDKKTKQLIR